MENKLHLVVEAIDSDRLEQFKANLRKMSYEGRHLGGALLLPVGVGLRVDEPGGYSVFMEGLDPELEALKQELADMKQAVQLDTTPIQKDIADLKQELADMKQKARAEVAPRGYGEGVEPGKYRGVCRPPYMPQVHLASFTLEGTCPADLEVRYQREGFPEVLLPEEHKAVMGVLRGALQRLHLQESGKVTTLSKTPAGDFLYLTEAV